MSTPLSSRSRHPGRVNYYLSRANAGVPALKRRLARQAINAAPPSSRAQVISRSGWAGVHPNPMPTGYKVAFDHAGQRRSRR